MDTGVLSRYWNPAHRTEAMSKQKMPHQQGPTTSKLVPLSWSTLYCPGINNSVASASPTVQLAEQPLKGSPQPYVKPARNHLPLHRLSQSTHHQPETTGPSPPRGPRIVDHAYVRATAVTKPPGVFPENQARHQEFTELINYYTTAPRPDETAETFVTAPRLRYSTSHLHHLREERGQDPCLAVCT